MNDIQQQLRHMLDTPGSPVSAAELEVWMNLYPYMVLPVVRYLQQNRADLDQHKRKRLMQHAAMHAPDSAAAHDLLDSPDGAGSFYPPQPAAKTPSTESAIDTFLDKYGKSDPAQDALLTRLIFNPTPDDYAGQLAAGSGYSPASTPDPSDNSHAAMIDRFIAGHTPVAIETGATEVNTGTNQPDDRRESIETESAPTTDAIAEKPQMKVATEPAAETPASGQASSALSLSLARIYIKQRRYDSAKEIITQLSLNNPEKSIYFADQLRFIDKLIRNQEYQRSKNQ